LKGLRSISPVSDFDADGKSEEPVRVEDRSNRRPWEPAALSECVKGAIGEGIHAGGLGHGDLHTGNPEPGGRGVEELERPPDSAWDSEE